MASSYKHPVSVVVMIPLQSGRGVLPFQRKHEIDYYCSQTQVYRGIAWSSGLPVGERQARFVVLGYKKETSKNESQANYLNTVRNLVFHGKETPQAMPSSISLLHYVRVLVGWRHLKECQAKQPPQLTQREPLDQWQLWSWSHCCVTGPV